MIFTPYTWPTPYIAPVYDIPTYFQPVDFTILFDVSNFISHGVTQDNRSRS